jgi:hypothetical protein
MVSYPVKLGLRPNSVTVGDLNGDRYLDIIFTNENGNNVGVLHGIGNENFRLSSMFPTGDNSLPASVTLDDFNHDGYLDIAVANFHTNNVGVLLGTDNGTFQNQYVFGNIYQAMSIVANDFNGDGKLDIAVLSLGNKLVIILIGTGHGTFLNTTQISTDPSPNEIASGDFNNDGRIDIVVANFYSNSIGIILNTCNCCKPALT